MQAPTSVSVKSGNLNNIFNRIIDVAVQPHLNIPETETGRSRKQYQQLASRSLMCMSGMYAYLHFLGPVGWTHFAIKLHRHSIA